MSGLSGGWDVVAGIAPLTVNGNFLNVPATGGLDTAAAGALNIGTVTATTITIGRAGQAVTFASPTINVLGGTNLDTSTAAALNIGPTNATLTLGRAGAVLSIASVTMDTSVVGTFGIGLNNITTLTLGRAGQVVNFGATVAALGGGAAPTFGTIGGTGPAVAAQNSWLPIQVAGVASWIPLWR